MKKLEWNEINLLKKQDSDYLHYLVYNYKNGVKVYPDKENDIDVAYVIERGGFISTMNEQFIATHIVPYGYYGDNVDNKKVDAIINNLKNNYPYAPQHDNWRIEV
jgi:hypothetical protein